MEINIKLKFAKKQKELPFDKSQKPFFLENTQLKQKDNSPTKKELRSYAQFFQKSKNEERQATLHHRSPSKDINNKIKPSTAKKRSKSKHRNQTPISTTKKLTPVKKNISDIIKAPKKKINIINCSNFVDQEAFRGSLPGLSGKKILQRYAPLLSQNQKIQLINQKTVYYIGIGAGPGQNDLQGTYLWKKHQQVGFRYQLLDSLGSGAFGEVIKAFDHKNKQLVAVKIIRSKKEHMQLALNEINILMRAKQKDIQNEKNIVRIKDFIVFRRHICIVTEILSISLFQLMQINQFRPIEMQYIRTFAIQILNALTFLREQNIIHSDIKPENILLKNRSKTGIKIIDFGTSMFIHQANFLYIQSRFYRAPQVILGGNYDYGIDMWSFACLLCELHTGSPLFPGTNEQEQMSMIMQVLGQPRKQFLKTCKNYQNFFQKDFTARIIKNKEGIALIPSTKPLSTLIKDKMLLNFLSKIFFYDPKDRLSPLQALVDPWIIDGLPEEIKQQHLNYVKLKMKKQSSTIQDKSTAAKNSAQKHTKRNSDFCGKEIYQKHKRRRSDGLMMA